MAAARQQQICQWIQQNPANGTLNPELVARACRSEGFCGKCTLRYSLGRLSISWSEWPGTDADDAVHAALESLKKDVCDVTPLAVEGDPWVPAAYNICPSCSGALQGRGQALIYTLSTAVEGGSSCVIQNEGYGGGQGKISQDVIQMTAHRAYQEAEKLVNGFLSTGSKKRRRADEEDKGMTDIRAQSGDATASLNLKPSHSKVVEWAESGLVGSMVNHVVSTHWIDDLVRMITESGYDLREGVCISIYPQKGLFDAEDAAYAKLCKRLGVSKLPIGFKIPDLKDLFRACVTQAAERIVYDTRGIKNELVSTSMESVINVTQSERVFEKAYKIQGDAEASLASSNMSSTNSDVNNVDNSHSHMDQLIEKLGGICGDARALSVDVSSAVMLDRSLPFPSAANVQSVVINVPSSERLQSNSADDIEASVVLSSTSVCLGTIETKTDHRQLFQSDSMGLAYIGGGAVSKTSSLRRLISTPGLSSLQLNVAIDSSPRGLLIKQDNASASDVLPPRVAIVTANIQRRSFFFKARYCKYKRGLSQTPWFVEGTRKIGSSSAAPGSSLTDGSSAGDSTSASVIHAPFTKLGEVEISEETSVEELLGGPVAELVASFCGQGCAVGLLPDDTPTGSSSLVLNSTLPLDANVHFFNTDYSSSSSSPMAVKRVLPRYKFHAAGREDVDVRMLGPGRPYMIELIDSKPAIIPLDAIARAHEILNHRAGGRLMTFPLSPTSREESTRLSNGAESKRKSYSALVWSSAPHTKERLKELIDDKVHNMVVKQLTPIRVMHRRTLMTRAKKIHSASSQWISPHYFLLTLTTSAGTYVKEFVHGDLGRTRPNVGELLSAGAPLKNDTDKMPASSRVVADILLLDVTDLVMTSGVEGEEEDDEEEEDSD